MAEITKQKIIIYILAILLVLALGYILIDKYNAYTLRKGAQIGYQQAVEQLIQQAVTCQPVSIYKENKSIDLISIQCLQQAQQRMQGQMMEGMLNSTG